MRSTRRILAILLAAFLASPAFAQSAPESVLRLEPGRLVRIEQKNSLLLQGPLRYATVDSLALGPDSSLAPMAFASIRTLHVRGRATGTGALIGAAVLGAACLGIGIVATAEGLVDDNERAGVAAFVVTGALAGATAGGLIGTLFPKWHKRYRAEE